MRRARVALLVALLALAGVHFRTAAQTQTTFDPALFNALRWRNIGPFRGGPTRAVAGVPSQPNVFYIGVDHGGVWKTTDAGRTWTVVFDDQPLGLITSIAIAAADPNTIDVAGSGGAYRSTDAGRTWKLTTPAPAAGASAVAHAAAPEWVNPQHPQIKIVGGDRGAAITVNGGTSWSTVLNQPTTAIEQVVADSAFPYRVCGGGEGVPPVCAQSRSDAGVIGARETTAIGVAANGHVAVDPADADFIYTGRVTRVDRRSGQSLDVSPPRAANFRAAANAPLLFLPMDPKTLLFGANTLWKTANGGQAWTEISPEMSKGVIATISASYVDRRVMWIGTDDGAIYVTRDDGATWAPVTPPAAGGAAIKLIESSHFDSNTAYAVVHATGADATRPRAYRTRDGGASWTEIVNGLPAGAAVNAVREDLFRRGLLFLGTDHTVHISFDDGERWQPLRLNLPVTSVRDLAIRDSDLIIATHGRGFWILDDLTPLRQITPDIARAESYLFRPGQGWRVRSASVPGAHTQSSEPAALNPPDGVAFTYALGPGFKGLVEIEVLDTLSGDLFRRFSSQDATAPLRATPGVHRVFWDVRYAPPDPGLRAGMFVLPGTYQVRLLANGRATRQAVVIRLDPRVRAPIADLTAQYKSSKAVDDMLRQITAVRRAATYASRPPEIRSALEAAALALTAAFERLQDADAKPTTTTDAAAAAALAAGAAALAQVKDGG